LEDAEQLRLDAREMFDAALEAADARRAVLEAVSVESRRLRVCGAEFDLGAACGGVYCVAVGKAGAEMAAALDERLGVRLVRGVVSAPSPPHGLAHRWLVYEGGHPLPNHESFAAARAALDLAHDADAEAARDGGSSLVVFLVSGGGSAMMEMPRDPRVTLEEMREANRVLVTCGAGISEVNAVRRALSAVKGGGLAAAAGRAAQVTLVVSDTNAGRERDVASGPTLEPDSDSPDPREIITRYGLAARLPASILRALEVSGDTSRPAAERSRREHFVLLDNATACEAAARAARRLGYSTELAPDLVEQHVEEGTAEMVSRLAGLVRRGGFGRGVCLISGGEFACPVRGAGVGGRNAETALRCAFEFEKAAGGEGAREFVALCAGTDGTDGNSPAAGALADHTTLARARSRGMSPERHLEESDAFTLFDTLGDALVTGPTGTNVRDLRILLSRA
jgi:hydroxypyruvate reductase